jgi:hypothetical protein
MVRCLGFMVQLLGCMVQDFRSRISGGVGLGSMVRGSWLIVLDGLGSRAAGRATRGSGHLGWGRVLSRCPGFRASPQEWVSCRDQVLQRSLQQPVCGENKPVKARCWPGLEPLYVQTSLQPFKLFPSRSAAERGRLLSRFKTRLDSRSLSEPLQFARLQALGAGEVGEAYVIVLGGLGHLVAHEAVVALPPLLLRVHDLLLGRGLGLRCRLLRLIYRL